MDGMPDHRGDRGPGKFGTVDRRASFGSYAGLSPSSLANGRRLGVERERAPKPWTLHCDDHAEPLARARLASRMIAPPLLGTELEGFVVILHVPGGEAAA